MSILADATMTIPTAVIGTVERPTRAGGHDRPRLTCDVGPATAAVDVFAWGCLIAYLTGGSHPFASQSEEEWILRVQSAEPDLRGLPSGMHDLIRATLARDPRDRPSARELATTCQARGRRTRVR
jgi:serine/threonine protein kinase